MSPKSFSSKKLNNTVLEKWDDLLNYLNECVLDKDTQCVAEVSCICVNALVK